MKWRSKEEQRFQSSCVLDSAPQWAGLGRASLCQVTGRIRKRIPGPRKRKGEVITKLSCLSVSKEGNLEIPGHFKHP